VTLFALAWTPHWQIAYRERSGITQTELLPAYWGVSRRKSNR